VLCDNRLLSDACQLLKEAAGLTMDIIEVHPLIGGDISERLERHKCLRMILIILQLHVSRRNTLPDVVDHRVDLLKCISLMQMILATHQCAKGVTYRLRIERYGYGCVSRLV
jgi:hypothetical protein